MDKALQFSDIPATWAICFDHDCPLAATCLRHHAATLAPAGLKHHECVLPAARDIDSCTLYVEDRPARLAYGMKHLLQDVKYEEGIAMRNELYDIFGSRSQYYHYYRGRWPISPRLQASVANLFRKYKLGHEPQFDNYSEGYYFKN